jgi:hypothetical protein
MNCELCGGGDEWIKTCLTPEGSRLMVCDGCYGENASVLVIVPGDRTVTARCDLCWRKNAYSGLCPACTKGERRG